jgi:hypothetical protein
MQAVILASRDSAATFRHNFILRLAEVFYNLEWILNNQPDHFDHSEWEIYETLYRQLRYWWRSPMERSRKRLCCQCRKGGASCGGPRCVLQPGCHAHQVEGRGGEDVLQMCFGVADVTTLAQATPPDGLRLRALNSGALGVLGGELGGLLPLPCGLDRLVMGLRPDGELPRRIFGLGARRADWTGAAGRGMEPDAHHGIARDIPAWRPSEAGLPLGTAGVLRLPVNDEGAQIIALACPPLVVIRPKRGADHVDLMLGVGSSVITNIWQPSYNSFSDKQLEIMACDHSFPPVGPISASALATAMGKNSCAGSW